MKSPVRSNEQTQSNQLVILTTSMQLTKKQKEERLKEINRKMEEHWNSEEFQESKKSHTQRLSEN